MLLGWMSTRVLGQYDLLVVEDEARPTTRTSCTTSGPNVLALEKRFAFPPQEFRLWLALHEVTHRAQFTGVPWLREHFLGLVEQTLDSVDPDPKRFFDALTQGARRPAPRPQPARRRRARHAARQPGAARGARQDRRADEPARGPRRRHHGPGRRRPDPERRALRPGAPRAAAPTPTPAAKLLQRLLGLEAKMNQYEQGERFIAEVERPAAARALDPVWRGAELAADPRGDPRAGGLARPRPTVRRARRLSSRTIRHARWPRVLVVDDEPDIRPARPGEPGARRPRGAHGRRRRGGAGGRRGGAARRRSILDVMMPQPHGWDVLERLKAARRPGIRTIPVVMLTALDTDHDQAAGGIEGAVRYLTKPLAPDDLRRRGRRRARRAARARAAQGRPAAGPRASLARIERDAGRRRRAVGPAAAAAAGSSTPAADRAGRPRSRRAAGPAPWTASSPPSSASSSQALLRRAVGERGRRRARHEPLERLRQPAPRSAASSASSDVSELLAPAPRRQPRPRRSSRD